MIYIIGDLHGNFKGLVHYLKSINADENTIIVSTGDFGYWPNFTDCWNAEILDKLADTGVKIYFCDGNHENHDMLKYMKDLNFEPDLNEVMVYHNIYYVPRGRVVRIEDQNFMFFGGANSIDKEWRTAGSNWFPGEDIKNEDLDNLPDIPVDVMITHTCPMEVDLPQLSFTDKLTDNNRKYLSILLEKYHPKQWYFGHWHYPKFTQKIDGTTFTQLNKFNDKGWVTKHD